MAEEQNFPKKVVPPQKVKSPSELPQNIPKDFQTYINNERKSEKKVKFDKTIIE